MKIRDYDESEHDVHIRANETNLNYMSCSPKHDNHRYNDSYDLYRSPCKYEIAALLALKNYIETYNPGDTTDRNTYYLMNTFKPKRQIVAKKTEDVIIRIPACYPRSVYNGVEYDFTDHLYKHGLSEPERDFDREQFALEAAMEFFNIPDTDTEELSAIRVTATEYMKFLQEVSMSLCR